MIDKDEEVKKIRMTIDAGVDKAAQKLQEYIKNWDE